RPAIAADPPTEPSPVRRGRPPGALVAPSQPCRLGVRRADEASLSVTMETRTASIYRSRRGKGPGGGSDRGSSWGDARWFKGPAALAIDDWFSSGSVPTNLNQARGYLASGASFQDIVQQLAQAGRSRSAFVHPYGRSRLQGPQFERVARKGYLEAIALA